MIYFISRVFFIILGWQEMLQTEPNHPNVVIQGYILTGWQRYDHFASLCEFLPVAIPSLKCCLIGMIRCQSPKYENGFYHWRHLASDRAMNTNDEILCFFLFG